MNCLMVGIDTLDIMGACAPLTEYVYIYSMYHLDSDGTYGPPLQLVKGQSGDSPIQGCSWVDSHVDVCHKLMFYTLNE